METFEMGMMMLMVYYQNFEFDTEPEPNDKIGIFKKKIWYDSLSMISDNQFMPLIESYCTNNIYPPQSPTHLIQHLKDMTLLGELSGDEAWEITYGLLKKNRFDVEHTADLLISDGKEACANALKEMRSRFRNLMTGDIPYVRKDFIEIYKRVVTQVVNQKVMIGGTSTLKIGSGGK